MWRKRIHRRVAFFEFRVHGFTFRLDIHEFLQDSITGPAKFTCSNGMSGCKFEEDAMNELIDSIFGDPYITLNCRGGECLHHSQVPGYVVSLCLLLVITT